ncbi:MAG: hypothetical protein COA62_15345 [Rhodobiaceae bacterium]|nr:MAG: hypothetical protein COA62_15345 [Rhodobiaceae bacterium]
MAMILSTVWVLTGLGIGLTLSSGMAHAEDGTRQEAPLQETEPTFSEDEVINAASEFFGVTAETMAEAIHKVFAANGEPNAYIQGQEGGGAIVIGARYGDGTLTMKSGQTAQVFWQGPSAGWDFGGDAAKVFTLIYNLPDTDAIYQRFPALSGSAFFIGGIGVNYQQRGDIILAPMRAGVGLRLGASVGYLNYTRERDWLPF